MDGTLPTSGPSQDASGEPLRDECTLAKVSFPIKVFDALHDGIFTTKSKY